MRQKRRQRTGASSSANSFRNLGGMPSGPEALSVFNPQAPGKGEISLPHSRAIFSKLKNEDKDLPFRNCKKWCKKSTKCNYFPFISILRELVAIWKSALHGGESEARGGMTRVWKPSSGCLWMNTAQYRFAIFWSLIFNNSDSFAAFLLKWSGGNGDVFINPIRQ